MGKDYGEVADKTFIILSRKQSFSGNAYLNGLQQSNTLDSNISIHWNQEKYYRNLDEQVLALITGEIGSILELKKPEDKPDSKKQRSFEPHEKGTWFYEVVKTRR